MAIWNPEEASGLFHTEDVESLSILEEELSDGALTVVGPQMLSADRRAPLHQLHRYLHRLWPGGGTFLQLYALDDEDGLPEEVVAADVLAALWDIADAGDLPPDIAGCSLAFLMDNGLWPESVAQFGDALFLALSGGGALGEGLESGMAADLARDYMDALFGEADDDALTLFGLDPDFSIWFRGEGYDIAYVMVNLDEGWLAIFGATDA
ncbi:MAG: hypothetical protein PVJ40_01080 [Gammaproteobacteria bacterium]|jgi:hypothetical protein